jgi:hypothetical protein
MSIASPLAEFIGGAFPSVWTLELLVLLRSRPERRWTAAELVEQLRGSEHIVAQGVGALVAGGLAATEDGGMVRYGPATPELERLVTDTVQLYARRPDAVRRAIVFGGSSSLQAFSEAFKLRGDP